MRRTVVAAAGIAVAAVALTGCNKSSFQCSNGSCDVSVGGNPSVDLSGNSSHSSSPGSRHHANKASSFEVTGYEGDVVRISSSGDQDAVRTGESKRIGELTFQVKSVHGDSAKLHVES